MRPDRDRYLLEHLVDGRPALPGMAMAVEAATRLRPGTPVRCLRDVRFEQFVWADPHEPGPTKYRVVADATGDTVRVRVLSDVVAGNGHVLSRDRCHAVLDVALGPPDLRPADHPLGAAALHEGRVRLLPPA